MNMKRSRKKYGLRNVFELNRANNSEVNKEIISSNALNLAKFNDLTNPMSGCIFTQGNNNNRQH